MDDSTKKQISAVLDTGQDVIEGASKFLGIEDENAVTNTKTETNTPEQPNTNATKTDATKTDAKTATAVADSTITTTTKSTSTLSKFAWFGNDADGLSVIDIIAVGNFILFIICKIVDVYLSIKFISDSDLITQLNLIMDDVNYNMYIIVCCYFGKKTADSIITKIGLFKTGQYASYLLALSDSTNETTEQSSDN